MQTKSSVDSAVGSYGASTLNTLIVPRVTRASGRVGGVDGRVTRPHLRLSGVEDAGHPRRIEAGRVLGAG